MDKVQLYVTVMLTAGSIGNLVGIMNARDSTKAAEKLIGWLLSAGFALPVVGRIFLWW